MFKAWLEKQTGRSREEIAKELGLSTVSLWRIANGEQNPSLATALRIERVTGIPALSWADTRLRLARAG